MIITKNIQFHYQRNRQKFKFPDICLGYSEDLLILGNSGIGKTTFLHIIAGILKPKNGKVIINNTTTNSLTNSKLDQFRGQNIGLVFQKKYAIQSLSVIKNLKSRLYFSKTILKDDEIDNLLDKLELLKYKHCKINELSEGQLQRFSIAMAIIHKPSILLADEPTSSLDDENCKKVIELLKNQAKETNANLIVITHDQRVKPYFKKQLTLS